MNLTATRLPAAEYTAIVKPRLSHSGTRRPAGVALVLKPLPPDELEQIYFFSSWRYLRERLRLFGFASPEELDSADVRLSTGRQPFMFASRRWEAPLIEALELNYR
jgi:hypothetical protein